MTIQELSAKGLMTSPHQGVQILEEARRETPETPLLARAALVTGAWLSGIFLAFFFGLLLEDTFDTPPIATTIGAIVIAGSLLLFRKTEQLFLEQLALAINFSGTLLFLYGIVEWMKDLGLRSAEQETALVVVTILCPIVFVLSRNAVQQFISLGWVFALAWIVAFDETSTPLLVSCFIVALALFLVPWLGRPNRFLNRATMYAGLVASVVTLVLVNAVPSLAPDELFLAASVWIRSLTVLGIAVGLFFVFQNQSPRLLGLIALVVLLLGAISWAGSPGVAFAIGLMAIAHAIGDRAIALLAPILLAGFLFLFYHYLGVPLLTKSLWLMGLGAVFLLACGISLRVLAPRLSR